MENTLIKNLSKVHTTSMGIERIKSNLKIECNDLVAYCKDLIEKESAIIERKGKN
jgi:hypothetical protein